MVYLIQLNYVNKWYWRGYFAFGVLLTYETTIELFSNDIIPWPWVKFLIQLFMKIKQSEINGDFCIIFNQIFSTFGIQRARGKSWQISHSYNQITCTKSPKKCIVVNNFQPLQIIIKQMPGSKENSKFCFLETFIVFPWGSRENKTRCFPPNQSYSVQLYFPTQN